MFGKLAVAVLAATALVVDASGPTVLVTGATGRTGNIVYGLLKKAGVDVRAFVRSAEKAKKLLNCTKCDASEGVYEGDLSKPETLVPAVTGATTLAIVTAAAPNCDDLPFKPCGYRNGSYPVDIDWHGGVAQIDAFAKATKGKGHVVLISAAGTTNPDDYASNIGNGHGGFYKLNEEAHLIASRMPFTIIKPCSLGDEAASTKELVVSHDDELAPSSVPRADVARVMTEAVMQPTEATGTRFDLCSKDGTPTTDLKKLFESARLPWQRTRTISMV